MRQARSADGSKVICHQKLLRLCISETYYVMFVIHRLSFPELLLLLLLLMIVARYLPTIKKLLISISHALRIHLSSHKEVKAWSVTVSLPVCQVK